LTGTAEIEPRSGSSLRGSALFVDVADGLGVRVEVRGAPPGLHGIHIHERGSCTAPDASSAGDHFDPGRAGHHGGPATEVRHGGDLGNIEVDANGVGHLDVVVSGITLDSVLEGVAGPSIVVDERRDDLKRSGSGRWEKAGRCRQRRRRQTAFRSGRRWTGSTSS
jgi:Cu-Zn family superoxide dismutase